jgi:Tol biopolymer transport system component
MLRPDVPVSLADLAAAGVRLRPVEVVTIVRELAQQVARGELPGVPSPHVIRLSPAGSVYIEGPVAAGGRSVARAAQLLETLLPGFDAPPEFRAPGALRLVVARALGTLDLPPYATLGALSDALARFAAQETAPVVRQLVASWAESVASEQPDDDDVDEREDVRERVLEAFAPAVPMPIVPVAGDELTVSDVRRARRATGLTLTEIGDRSRIPVSLLRELEWGYVRNWPGGQYGRIQLVRYARAAGLDEEIVIRAVWPLLEEARVDLSESPLPLAVGESRASGPIVFRASNPHASSDSRAARVLAGLAIPVLLAVALAPALWQRMNSPLSTTADSTRAAAAAGPGQAPPSAPAGRQTVRSEPLNVVRQRSATAREPDGLVPPARPGAGLVNHPVAVSAGEPPFSSVGTAVFHEPDASGAVAQDEPEGRGPVLRITRIVDDTAQSFHARPSPDGRRIAFDSNRDGERAVYVADANGQHVRRISGEGFAAVPSWSPDSRSLAFVKAEPDNPGVWNLWTADIATGASGRVTDHSEGQPWGGSWFPDGKRIAYAVGDQLIVLDLQTSTKRQYRSPRRGRAVRVPTVSPVGERVMFQVIGDGAWLLDLSDGSMRRVLSDPTAEEYTWAPDGSRVAYYSRRAGSWGVWVMAPR